MFLILKNHIYVTKRSDISPGAFVFLFLSTFCCIVVLIMRGLSGLPFVIKNVGNPILVRNLSLHTIKKH